ncbi:type II toxin-antitoxin system VapC family toxin [Salinarchaeum laminariae]|uniref:type II toxin-antitoxin system VapC family toxin n=1 Tax=Salinarchaeum laminariae TaxID=869888 RepID=UPI0020BF3FA2|nr:type II toxin-antitoxin system VapC family toxin [Salinarchaeum laminariae]
MDCLDANIWIYYLDEELDEHDAVVNQVGDVVRAKPLFLTTVLQLEVLHYVSNQRADCRDVLDTFLTGEDVWVADLTSRNVERASELLETHKQAGIGGRDASVLATMERNDVTRLWTHDAALRRVGEQLDWLEVSDPVAD